MRNFWIYLGCLVAVMLLYLFGGEYLVRQVPNPYKYKHEWMKKHQGEVEILTFGGSHSFYGINPKILGDKAFSLANVSQTFEYDYFLFTNYECPNLKEIVLAISFPTLFSGKMEDGKEWWRTIFYKIYMDCPFHSDFSKYNFEFCNFQTFRGKLAKRFSHSELDYDEWGCNTINKLKNKDTMRWNSGIDAVEAAQRHNKTDFSKLDTNLSRLQKIADYCQERNIKLYLVTTPCWKDYNDKLNVAQLLKMQEAISEFQKANPNALYFNYLTDNRFVANDFFDSNHLTTDGAIKFTKILKKDIERH